MLRKAERQIKSFHFPFLFCQKTIKKYIQIYIIRTVKIIHTFTVNKINN